MAENIMLREKLGLKTTEQVRNAQALDSTEWSESRRVWQDYKKWPAEGR